VVLVRALIKSTLTLWNSAGKLQAQDRSKASIRGETGQPQNTSKIRTGPGSQEHRGKSEASALSPTATTQRRESTTHRSQSIGPHEPGIEITQNRPLSGGSQLTQAKLQGLILRFRRVTGQRRAAASRGASEEARRVRSGSNPPIPERGRERECPVSAHGHHPTSSRLGSAFQPTSTIGVA
jgi:hypothetical protein